MKVNINRQKVGLEDLEFGLGTVEQLRQGVLVTVTQINAGSMPFDALRTLSDVITHIDPLIDNLAEVLMAGTYAATALASANNADASELSTLEALTSFKARYLGSFATDPLLDTAGLALIEGATYWNSTTKLLKIWDATTWVNALVLTENSTNTLINKTLDSITNTIGADHVHYKVRNASGATILAGTIVTASGTQPGTDYIQIIPVTDAQTQIALGIVHTNLANNGTGLVVNVGVHDNTNTGAWTVGTVLYPNNAGWLTTTKPTSGQYQACAIVLRQHATSGTLLCEFTNPTKIASTTQEGYVQLNDTLTSTSVVQALTAAQGKVLQDGKVAINTAITAGTNTKITYDAKGLVTAGTALAATDIPALDTSKLTTGTLPVLRGGTGTTTNTGTGSVVLNTSPTLATPVLGVATGTSFNGITGLASVAPLAPAVTAVVGVSTLTARADHIHPTDTTKANVTTTVAKDSDTGAAVLPAGTTAQRPVTPVNGYMRYNSDLLAMEAYVNGVWGSVADSTGVVLTTTDQTITGTKSFSTGIKVGGANVTAYGQNYIINGGFDYWNYATSQTTSGYSSDDRWYNVHSGSTKTHSMVNATDAERALFNSSKFSRTVVASVAGATNYVIKRQSIENVTKLAGKTITLSFWAKADATKNICIKLDQLFGTGGIPSAYVVDIGTQLVALTSAWQKKTITIAIPSIVGKTLGTDGVHTSATYITFGFDVGSTYSASYAGMIQQSGTFDIAEVKLEGGSVATPWTPYEGEFGGEVQACQRYYEVLVLTGSTDKPFWQWNYYKVAKRTIPTLGLIGSSVGASYDSPSNAGFRCPAWTKHTAAGDFSITASAEL